MLLALAARLADGGPGHTDPPGFDGLDLLALLFGLAVLVGLTVRIWLASRPGDDTDTDEDGARL